MKERVRFPRGHVGAWLHNAVIDFLFREMGRKGPLPHFGTVDRFVGTDEVEYLGKGARVVHLRMVADNEIDFSGVDDLSDVVQELIGEGLLHRINEHHLVVINDQKGVVACPHVRGVSMEISDVPILNTHIVDAFGYFKWSHDGLSLAL